MRILWDFDGTLFDTYPAYTDIFKEVIGESATKQEILSQLKVSFTHAVKYFGLSEEEIQFILGREERLLPELTPPFPYVDKILAFAELNVIMTHKPRKEVQCILQYYGMESLFQDMIAGDDGYARKPDPASYAYLHHKYEIDLVIGDRELDILPAQALGIKTCLFQNDAPGADYYLSSYEAFFDHNRIHKISEGISDM